MRLLALSDIYSHTLDLVSSGQVTCDVVLSEAVVENHPEEGPALCQEIQQMFPHMWQTLAAQLPENRWIVSLQDLQKSLSFSVILVTDPEIQSLNREFRGKDTPTDVLTFTLLEEMTGEVSVEHLPELNLGEIYISLDWAKTTICKQFAENPSQNLNFFRTLTLFVLERLVHGCLHLLGVHHDTMSDYNKVIAIQRVVVHGVT